MALNLLTFVIDTNETTSADQQTIPMPGWKVFFRNSIDLTGFRQADKIVTCSDIDVPDSNATMSSQLMKGQVYSGSRQLLEALNSGGIIIRRK